MILDDNENVAYADFEATVAALLTAGADPNDLIDLIRKIDGYLQSLKGTT